jgi:hypothetical protein
MLLLWAKTKQFVQNWKNIGRKTGKGGFAAAVVFGDSAARLLASFRLDVLTDKHSDEKRE